MSPEKQLLSRMFDELAKEEARYLKWLLARVVGGSITVARGRELILRRFPHTEWMRR